MSEPTTPQIGSIGWIDLTVENADEVRNFYSEVVGWTFEGLDMGGYDDYVMNEPVSGKPVAGVCHARGTNAGLPPVWLLYVNVADLDASIARCRALGGEVIAGPKSYGGQGKYCMIRDPAGAHLALFEPAT